MRLRVRSATGSSIRENGFALVITLIMVVLCAVIAVALLSNATLDRTTAKSVGDRYQAEIAARNALEAAKKALTAAPDAVDSVVKDDTFLVLRADGSQSPNSYGNRDAYYFFAKARARNPGTGESTEADCYPLFSGGTASVLGIDHVNYPPLQSPAAPAGPFANPAQDAAGKPYPRLFSYQQPVSLNGRRFAIQTILHQHRDMICLTNGTPIGLRI